MSRVLVVEDDTDIADLIAHCLQKAGHTVETAASGTAALRHVKEAAPDLILLDLMLPGMDGLLVCQTLRSDAATARAPASAAEVKFTYGRLTIDVERHAVEVDGVEVKLTAKEFLLLQYLVEHQGRVLSRDLLLTDVWGYQYTGGTRTVDVHIRRLREKVPFLAGAIVTIKQFGYRLEEK